MAIGEARRRSSTSPTWTPSPLSAQPFFEAFRAPDCRCDTLGPLSDTNQLGFTLYVNPQGPQQAFKCRFGLALLQHHCETGRGLSSSVSPLDRGPARPKPQLARTLKSNRRNASNIHAHATSYRLLPFTAAIIWTPRLPATSMRPSSRAHRPPDVIKLKGRRTSEVATILGYQVAGEIIHRDNLVLL